MRRLIASVVVLLLSCGGSLFAQQPIVLRAARMIDGTGAAPVNNAAVIVIGDRITALGPASSVAIPAGANVIDLGDVTILPGFIDAHTHIIGRTLGDPMSDLAVVKDYQGYGAIIGVDNARRTLMAGFTSIRVVGASSFDDMMLSPSTVTLTGTGARPGKLNDQPSVVLFALRT